VLTVQSERQRIFPKEQCICEPDSFLSQAACWYVCERPSYSLCSLDKTTHFFLDLWNTGRACQKQTRAHGRKCALTTTTDHPQAAGETASMHQYGSHASRARSSGRSGLEANAHDSFNQTPSRRFHRELFRLYWRRRSKASSHKPKLAAETITLIGEMAKENRLWGAERIRGELLKLGIRVCKRTIQKYMRHVRSPQPRGQKWATFVHNHAAQIWACDALSGHRSLLSTARGRSSSSN
jgi:hypothetical protein